MSASTKWRYYTKLAENALQNNSSSDSESPEKYSKSELSDNIDKQTPDLSDHLNQNDSDRFSSADDCLKKLESDSNSDFDYLSSDSDSYETLDIRSEIAAWAILFLIKNDALSALLHILRKHGLKLPKDARTVLKTPTNVGIINKSGGNYVYFGLKNGLESQLKYLKCGLQNFEIKLKINIDGIQLFKSSSASLWPILCSFNKFPPFVVSLYYGLKKPEPISEYLSDFLEELLKLLHTGITFNDIVIPIKVFAFVCDAPARQHLKCIKSHTGYYCCERCQIKGYRSRNQVVFYAVTESALRTDADFNNFVYSIGDGKYNDGHQLGRSPLMNNFSCINSFSLDYMHLVCLGVMRRMFYFWKKGSKSSLKCKIKHSEFARLSENLGQFSNSMPSEFARKPRGCVFFEKWKATEYRQFMLYTGPVVLKNILNKSYYSHFLCLSVSMTILLNQNCSIREEFATYAKNLLKHFVIESKKLYTDLFVSYNVHNLIHLVSDSEYFNSSLDEISAFEFENCLQLLKRKVRSGNRPLAQLAKRAKEAEQFNFCAKDKFKCPKIGMSSPDNVFLLSSAKYAFVSYVQENDNYLCSVIRCDLCENFYPEPFNSKLLNIYKDGYVLLPTLHLSG